MATMPELTNVRTEWDGDDLIVTVVTTREGYPPSLHSTRMERRVWTAITDAGNVGPPHRSS